jgi:hypothetical protein
MKPNRAIDTARYIAFHTENDMTSVEQTSLHPSSAAFATLLEKLGNAFSAPSVGTQFSTTEAATAGAFVEDAVSDRDVMEDGDGY